MKPISIVLIIILLGAAAIFFLRDKGSREELGKATAEITKLSNAVARAETVGMMHSSTNSQLRDQFTNVLTRLNALSNRVAKTSEDLKQSMSDHQTVRTDLQQATKRAADGNLRIAELQSEAQSLRKMIEGRDAEITRLTANLKQAEADRADFHQRAQKAEADVVRLQLDLTDEAVLRAQMDRLKRQWPPAGFAKLPKTDPKGGKDLTARTDTQAKGYYLQIQPDGSVKVLPPLEAAGGAR